MRDHLKGKTILQRINEFKQLEVERRQTALPIEALKDTVGYHLKRSSLSNSIRSSDQYGIIAEFKRKSPSQNDINVAADPTLITTAYAEAGAAAISCLTDHEFFGAQRTDIDRVRQAVSLPVLRKDFIVDRYQLHESCAMGADAVLLIAASLSAGQIDDYAAEATEIGLEVLCEVHSEEEARKVSPRVHVAGVNNRNLEDFSVSISTSLRLIDHLPAGVVRISESGIDDPQAVAKLKYEGYQGFLIGTHFMRQNNPGAALKRFIEQVRDIDGIYEGAIA